MAIKKTATSKTSVVAPVATAPAAVASKTFTQTFTVAEPKKHSVHMKMSPDQTGELALSSMYLNRAVFAQLGIPEGSDPSKVQITIKVTATAPVVA